MAHRLAHHSGRFDNNLIGEGFEKTRKGCTLASWTEFGSDRRAAMLKQVAGEAGWDMFQNNEHGFDDLAFTWDRRYWRFLQTAGTQLSDIKTWSTEGHLRPPLCAQAVLMESLKQHTKWAMLTWHTPAHVATMSGWRREYNRIRQYKDAMPAMGRWIRELDKAWHQHGFVLTADWNAPMEQLWFRNFVESNLPAPWHVMEPNKPPLVPYPDTHDSRCIDWAVLSPRVHKVGDATALEMPDSDHRTMFFKVDLS